MRRVVAILADLRRELAELGVSGPRGLICLMAALSVMLSVTITSLAHLPDLWWAAISGFMSLQASQPASLRRAVLRVLGTAIGAFTSLALLPWLAYDHVALALALWGFATVAILGFLVSPHGYAWLFFAITFILVTLLSVAEPTTVVANAVNRTLEVTIGSAVAVGVTWALASPAALSAPSDPAPGWRDLLGRRLPEVMFAARGGFAVMLTPVLWRLMELPSLVQMPITVAAVMAVPVAISDPQRREAVVRERALQRLIGCFCGGLFGLLCLAVAPASFAPWLVLLGSGIWLSAHVQASARGVGTVGTQAAIAFMLTLVQGAGPPTSILPGIDRFIGVTMGLAVLLGVTVALDFVLAPLPAATTGPVGARGA